MCAFLPYPVPMGEGSNGSNSLVRQAVGECPVIARRGRLESTLTGHRIPAARRNSSGRLTGRYRTLALALFGFGVVQRATEAERSFCSFAASRHARPGRAAIEDRRGYSPDFSRFGGECNPGVVAFSEAAAINSGAFRNK